MIANSSALALALASFFVLARFGLAAVFGFAGMAKLADFHAARQSVVDFGVPALLGAIAAAALTGGELAVATGLLFDATAAAAAMAGAVLLVAFSAAIATNLAKGRHPGCNCFGQAQSSPIGAGTLLRNLAFAGVASFLIVEAPMATAVGLPGAADFGQSVDRMLVVGVLAITTMIVVQLRTLSRQQDMLARRLDTLSLNAKIAVGAQAERPDLPVGTAAPDFRLADADGVYVALADFLATGRATLLIFTNPRCLPCAKLAPDIDAWQRDHRALFNIVRVSEGAPGQGDAGGLVLWQDHREVADAYRCWGTPGALLIRPDGTIGSAVAKGVPEVRLLVKKITSEALAPKSVESMRAVAPPAV
jgi:methylamine utilization protein MauE/AhpC/TSA family protein